MPCLYIYSDESGVFDQAHYDLFVYGGLLFPSKEIRERARQTYDKTEKSIRSKKQSQEELKGSTLSPEDNLKLLHTLDPYLKFACLIDQKAVSASMFRDKKTKQRYLDYVFEDGLRNVIDQLIHKNALSQSNISAVNVAFDRHTVATNNAYELTEGLETELALGSCDFARNECLQALFPSAKGKVAFRFGESDKEILIRAADVVCHHVFVEVQRGNSLDNLPNLVIAHYPDATNQPTS